MSFPKEDAMTDVPSWAVPLIAQIAVAGAMLKIITSQLGAIKKELHELSREFRTTREDIAALQKSDGYHQAQIEKLEERIQRLSEYWRRSVGQ